MQVTSTCIIENIFSVIAQIKHRRTNITQFLLIGLADAFGLIRRINPELSRITLMIIEMRPVYMEDDKHILVRFIQFLFQIRQKGVIIQ